MIAGMHDEGSRDLRKSISAMQNGYAEHVSRLLRQEATMRRVVADQKLLPKEVLAEAKIHFQNEMEKKERETLECMRTMISEREELVVQKYYTDREASNCHDP